MPPFLSGGSYRRSQITVRLKEGNTIYRFTASFDGMHTLPEKAVKLIDSEGSV